MGIRLSKSAIGKFEQCQRCFYLQYRHGLKQPEAISSKLWKGVEGAHVAHYERHRAAGTLPPELCGKVPDGSSLYPGDKISIKAMRYWGHGLRFQVDGIEVTTALDELLQQGQGEARTFNVLDYKTKSKPTTLEATAELYQTQQDVFDMALNANGYPSDGRGFFAYLSPLTITEAAPAKDIAYDGTVMMRWNAQVIALEADHARIKKLVLAAAACLDSGLPEPNIKTVKGKKGDKLDGCPVCVYLHDREALFDSLKATA